MKTQAILILSILFVAFLAQVSATSINGNTLVAEEETAPNSIFQCIQSVFNLAKWGYSVVVALINEDFGQLMPLITQLIPLFQAFTAGCL